VRTVVDIAEVSESIAAMFLRQELAGETVQMAEVVKAIKRQAVLEEDVAILRQLRFALAQDLQHISTANGYSMDVETVAAKPINVRENNKPAVFISGGAGDSDRETISNMRRVATHRFDVILAVATTPSDEGIDRLDDLTDDIRNCVERDAGTLRAQAGMAGVETIREIPIEDDIAAGLYLRNVTVLCEYMYNSGAA
jgi:hypothetical protein